VETFAVIFPTIGKHRSPDRLNYSSQSFATPLRFVAGRNSASLSPFGRVEDATNGEKGESPRGLPKIFHCLDVSRGSGFIQLRGKT